jgi:hypothetical protein
MRGWRRARGSACSFSVGVLLAAIAKSHYLMTSHWNRQTVRRRLLEANDPKMMQKTKHGWLLDVQRFFSFSFFVLFFSLQDITYTPIDYITVNS